MTCPIKPWESTSGLQNSSQFIRTQNSVPSASHQFPGRNAPVLPPRPANSLAVSSSSAYGSTFNSFMPYSGMGGSPYSSYGSYGMPYRNPMYNSYGTGYGNYGMNGLYNPDDSERRFIQYAEESSRHTFASVESVVRAFNSLAMMLDNTFFAMTSSFRAVLSVAENFGRLRTMFGHIWYSINVFRFITWLYRKLRQMLGLKVQRSATSVAWNEAATGSLPGGAAAAGGSSWPTLAFLGVLVSAPYIISKFLPKYEDKTDPSNWKTPGVRAKACFDFVASSPNELSIHTNDVIILAPPDIQEEMNLKNSGWAFAVFNGKSGVVPLNYLVISKNKPISHKVDNANNVPVPRVFNENQSNPAKTHFNDNQSSPAKTHTKRVSFGDIQIFETDDYDVKYNNNDNTSNNVASQISQVETKPVRKVEVKPVESKKEIEGGGVEAT